MLHGRTVPRISHLRIGTSCSRDCWHRHILPRMPRQSATPLGCVDRCFGDARASCNDELPWQLVVMRVDLRATASACLQATRRPCFVVHSRPYGGAYLAALPSTCDERPSVIPIDCTWPRVFPAEATSRLPFSSSHLGPPRRGISQRAIR
jgi:hypothetical protein